MEVCWKRILADNKVVFGICQDFTYLCKVKRPRWWLPARKDKKVRIILPQKQNETIDAATIKAIKQCVFPLCPKDTAGKLSYLPSASWQIRTHSVRWQGSMPRHTLPWGFKTCHAFEGEHHMCVPEWMVKRNYPWRWEEGPPSRVVHPSPEMKRPPWYAWHQQEMIQKAIYLHPNTANLSLADIDNPKIISHKHDIFCKPKGK